MQISGLHCIPKCLSSITDIAFRSHPLEVWSIFYLQRSFFMQNRSTTIEGHFSSNNDFSKQRRRMESTTKFIFMWGNIFAWISGLWNKKCLPPSKNVSSHTEKTVRYSNFALSLLSKAAESFWYFVENWVFKKANWYPINIQRLMMYRGQQTADIFPFTHLG